MKKKKLSMYVVDVKEESAKNTLIRIVNNVLFVKLAYVRYVEKI
ncbi:hypothetical protein [Candidatus Acidianus copahuensis]|nr:hypothetical protein [Candidatus Acidianus copahuensis]